MAERRRRRNRGNQTPGFIRSEQRQSAKQEEVKLWEQRIQHARTIRKRWEQRFRVDELADHFNGMIEQLITSDDDITINRMYPTIKAMLPGLAHQNPTFLVRATSKSASGVTRAQAELAQSLLKAIGDQDQHLKRQTKLALQQAFFRVGVLKVLYDPKTEKNPRAGEPKIAMQPGGQPLRNEFSGQPVILTDPDTGEEMVEEDETITDEIYEWAWVDAATMLFPDEGPSRRHWTWIAEEITVPLSDAQEDTRFPRALRNQLRAMKPVDREHDDGGLTTPIENQLDPEVTYIEIWDSKEKRRIIWAEGQPFSAHSFLMDEPLPDGIEDDPYALLMFNPITDPKPSPWPKPVTSDWLALQQIYNIRRQQMINAANRSTRKVGYDEATFPNSDEAIAALQSDQDMEAVKLNDVNRPWVVVPDPSSPPDIAREMVAERQDWIDVTGQTGARLGDPEGDTATEAMITERANNLRDVEQRSAVQDWLGEAGQKMWQVVKQTLTLGIMVKLKDLDDQTLQRYVSRVYGPQVAQVLTLMPGMQQQIIDRFGQDRFLRVTRDAINFEAAVTISPGSARARSLELERQQLLAFVRIIAQFPHVLLSRELVRMIGDLFEFVNEGLLDELHAVGQIMMQAQAGGGASPGGAPNPSGSAPAGGSPVVAGQLRTLLTGANANAVL